VLTQPENLLGEIVDSWIDLEAPILPLAFPSNMDSFHKGEVIVKVSETQSVRAEITFDVLEEVSINVFALLLMSEDESIHDSPYFYGQTFFYGLLVQPVGLLPSSFKSLGQLGDAFFEDGIPNKIPRFRRVGHLTTGFVQYGTTIGIRGCYPCRRIIFV
jgi:hypothetical protein